MNSKRLHHIPLWVCIFGTAYLCVHTLSLIQPEEVSSTFKEKFLTLWLGRYLGVARLLLLSKDALEIT